MAEEPKTLKLTLLSHTNVGKTTLARTLLRKDVGEVLDQAHVTDAVAEHVLLEGAHGEQLILRDTPGFGDSVRLLRTMREHEQPIAWLSEQAFDRHGERALYCDREAVFGVQQQSDVVLYLVNAAERPEDAGYVDAELEILSWIDKPVLLLLNQTGPPRSLELSDDERRWREATAKWKVVRGVLGLDAFTRCWVQEGRLFEEVRSVVAGDRRELAESFVAAWRRSRLAVFRSSMELFAAELVRAASDEEGVVEGAWGNDKAQAMGALAGRMEAGTAAVVDRLISEHGIEGRAELEFRSSVDDFKAKHEKLAHKRWGLFGGVATGVVTGLGADLAAGGMTLGGGMLLGGLAGGFGAAGLAKAYNTVRGDDQATLRWSPEVLNRSAAHLLLRYLAVAHFGRGRGSWREREVPNFWRRAVSEAIEARAVYFKGVWKEARGATGEAELRELRAQLVPLFTGAAREVLAAFYPESSHLL